LKRELIRLDVLRRFVASRAEAWVETMLLKDDGHLPYRRLPRGGVG